MRKKTGFAMILAGAVLILSALLLFLYNEQESASAGQEAESLLSDVQAAIVGQTEPAAGDTEPSTEPSEAPEETVETDLTMKVVTINGNDYVGYLAIPSLELQLPVMSDWDYDKLNVSPCRHFGSTKSDDLVIAAHNFSTHFGHLRDLKVGDTVTFTDMDGEIIEYTVVRTGVIAPTDVEAVVNSGNDLVLYTCTPGGQTRVCVFCDRVEKTEAAG